MAKIYFGRPGAQLDQTDLKGEKEISWCQSNFRSLTFLSPLDRMPKMPDEESTISPDLRNYKFVVIQVEEENSELKPGFYLSSLTPKEVWEKL
ncbi:MAG: hypothetical protein ACXU97_08580 [Thermodesulfobacteriota bacterium]